MPLRPLLLTGPPAVGKSTVARELARQEAPAAVVEVDDLRRMVVAGGVAPWEPEEGARQTRLAAEHTCLLMSSFQAAGFSVLATDVLLAGAGRIYRSSAAQPLIVHLTVPVAEAQRRAATRDGWLTDEEFLQLHEADRHLDVADVEVATTTLALPELVVVLHDVWRREGQA